MKFVVTEEILDEGMIPLVASVWAGYSSLRGSVNRRPRTRVPDEVRPWMQVTFPTGTGMT